MTETSTAGDTEPAVQRIQLDVTGMTCGMCSSHIAKKLNKIDGVQASVDLATRVATIEAANGIAVTDLCEVVRQAGYGATERPAGSAEPAPVESTTGPLRQLVAAAVMVLRWLGIR